MHRSYLLRVDGEVVERPQFLYMRVAVAIHGKNVSRVLETYHLLAEHAYTHATPTLFNAGTNSQHLASCFLYQPPAESTVSVMGRCATDVSALWHVDGGVGMSLGAVPAREYVGRFIFGGGEHGTTTNLCPARTSCRILQARSLYWRSSMCMRVCTH